jgi:hypothetical protein
MELAINIGEPAIADDIFSRSLRHDMICAYHLAPAPGFVVDEGGRFGRRAAVRRPNLEL